MKKAVFKTVHLLMLLLVCNVYVFAQCDNVSEQGAEYGNFLGNSLIHGSKIYYNSVFDAIYVKN